MTKLIHLNNQTAGKVPLTTELSYGQLAMNNADGKLYILGTGGSVISFSSTTAEGTVTAVNTVGPDGTGNVTLTAANLGATATGVALFTAASASAARTTLGATTVGSAVFTAASGSAALTAQGATATGISILTAADAPTAVTALGGTSVGAGVFTAVSTTAAQTALGITATGQSLTTAASVSAAVAVLQVIPTSSIGVANGVVPLDASSKISSTYLPDSILGGVNFQGLFTPGTTTLPAAASGNKGWYYIATAAGTYTPPSGTLLTFKQGDWLISEGTAGWSTVMATDAVTAVNGKTGAVTIVASDITSGTFAAAQLGSSTGNSRVLTTSAGGAPTWATTLSASQIGASAGNSLVMTTSSGGAPTWAATVPTANLPVATAAALGVAQAGTGLSVAAGVFSVNTSVLTLDEGLYVGA